MAILAGLFNLVNFIIHNFKKPLFNFKKHVESFPLRQEETSQLIFFVMFLALIIYFSQWLILIFKLKVNPLGAIIFSNLAIETGVILITCKYIKSSYLDFRLNTSRALGVIKNYLMILPILVGTIFINSFILEKSGITTSINPAIELFLKIRNIPLLSLLLFQIIFLGPVAEEIFFRGFIYKLLRKKYNFLLSAVSSSFLFAMLHRSSHDVLPLLILSIGLCYIYEKNKNIASPILFHIIHNSFNASFLLLIKITT
jgi:membrane protease YdiL (CAAX protease family)